MGNRAGEPSTVVKDCMTIEYTVATGVGGRPHQEDRWFVGEFPTGHLFAVMDGHGGFSCVERVRELIPLYWAAHDSDELKANPELRLTEVIASLAVRTNEFTTGCTISLVFIPKEQNKAYVAILGDSPVILNSEGSVTLSPEHNARTNMAERQAAIARGAMYHSGYLWNGSGKESGGLQMSRALGDKELTFLSRKPETYVVNLVPECYMILATDGLLDPAHGELTMLEPEAETALQEIVRWVDSGHGASEIVDVALGHNYKDNVTAIVVRILKD
jgi:serine/threonine protein phosphatase PrpC